MCSQLTGRRTRLRTGMCHRVAECAGARDREEDFLGAVYVPVLDAGHPNSHLSFEPQTGVHLRCGAAASAPTEPERPHPRTLVEEISTMATPHTLSVNVSPPKPSTRCGATWTASSRRRSATSSCILFCNPPRDSVTVQRSSRDTVDGERPIRRATSRTPNRCECRMEISSLSAKGR